MSRSLANLFVAFVLALGFSAEAKPPKNKPPITVQTGNENADGWIRRWIEQFQKSEVANDPIERPVAYGVSNGGPFVVFRNNNGYVYVDRSDDVRVEGWKRVENPREAAAFVPNPPSPRYCLGKYVYLPGERAQEGYLSLDQLITEIGGRLQRTVKPYTEPVK